MKSARAAFAFALLSLQLGVTAGCGADESEKRSVPVGTVTGFIRLAPGQALPMYPDVLLSREPLRPRERPDPLPEACERARDAARLPVLLSEARGLSGMLVTASEFRRAPRREPIVHRVRIEHCALAPQAVAMSEGDRLVLENLDAFPFAPLYGPAYEARPLPQGKPLFVPVHPGTIEPLSCSADAPCGRSDVFVLRHPVHALTDARGAFRIANFPAGEQVRLTAVHPLFEESETSLWLEPGETVSVELTVRPKARFVPPAP